MWKCILMEKMEAIKNSLQTVPHVLMNFKQYSKIGRPVDVTKYIEIICSKCL